MTHMNNNYFRQISFTKKIVLIFLFTTIFLNLDNIYAANKPPEKPPVTMKTKTYNRASWTNKCVAAGGECILTALYNSQIKTLESNKISNAECADEKNPTKNKQYVCVNKEVGGKYLCTRCSNNKGCQSVSFYASAISDTSKDTANQCSKEPSTDAKATYAPDPSCGAVEIKDKTYNNDACACEKLNGQCAEKCSDDSLKIDNAACTTAGQVCCSKAANKPSQNSCAAPNRCETGSACSSGGAPVVATCATQGQVCCPTSPAAIANQASMTCTCQTALPGNLCQTGTATRGGNCTAGQMYCCSQAANPLQQLMSSVGSWLNKLLNPTASTGSNTATPSIETSTTSTVSGPTPTPQPGSLDNPNGVDVSFNLKIKLHGITKKPKDALNNVMIKVSLVDTTVTSGKKTAISYGDFTAGDNGIWTGTVTFAKVEPKTGYQLLIKGPKHVQKKVCTTSPTESYPGGYSCKSIDLLAVAAGANEFDLTGIYLMAGDVAPQDGIVNSIDLTAVKTKFGMPDMASLNKSDLNYDGSINSQDWSLILYTLQAINGTDEN